MDETTQIHGVRSITVIRSPLDGPYGRVTLEIEGDGGLKIVTLHGETAPIEVVVRAGLGVVPDAPKPDGWLSGWLTDAETEREFSGSAAPDYEGRG